MLTGLHFLLSYKCTFECDHCFVYSSPSAEGTFTLAQVRNILDEAVKMGSIQTIYFEGGEPFLFYPLLMESIRLARSRGFQVGVVTNAYYATSEEDAELWLGPLRDLGVSDVSISDDLFHSASEQDSPARRALRAASRMGLPAGSICIEQPVVELATDSPQGKGEPVVGGGVMFRGRAIDKLVQGLPRKPWDGFVECPHEDLENPGRVHLDAYGNVHLCQGIVLGNLWDTPLPQLVNNYQAALHPICSPLIRGGPALLAKEYNVEHEDGYVDACHLCYTVRKALLDRFPQFLAPKQVYGITA